MNNSYHIVMKKKFTTTAYMRDATNYTTSIYNLEDCYLVVKKINKVKKPWISYNGTNVMDKDFFMLECTPKNEHYSMRIFYNKEKQPLLYYFDITKENGFDNSKNSPYYIDIYTDIMIFTKDNNILIVDENELKQALNEKEITLDDFNQANSTCKKLYNELKMNLNIYKNLDFSKYLI